MWHGLLYWVGMTNASGRQYLFWSGIGSDLGELTIVAGLVAVYRKHNCHVRRCWRIGKHSVDGTPYTTCHRHHPHSGQFVRRPTAEQVVQAYDGE